MENWIRTLFELPEMTKWGHLQSVHDANLGLGWIYYGLARVTRPATVVVIGSYRGFVPLLLGKALHDNLDGGRVIFIDPSMVDDFWRDPSTVASHFSRFGISNITHHLMTTQEYAQSSDYIALQRVEMVFVDGYHSEEQARLDYQTFEKLLVPNGFFLFHDTAGCETSRVYGPDRAYQRRVRCFIDELKLDPGLQVFDLPFDAGVSLVRRVTGSAT
jgi:predicted O-methyltransferase YrrM